MPCTIQVHVQTVAGQRFAGNGPNGLSSYYYYYYTTESISNSVFCQPAHRKAQGFYNIGLESPTRPWSLQPGRGVSDPAAAVEPVSRVYLLIIKFIAIIQGPTTK